MASIADTIQGYYTTILNRDATANEIATWTNLIDSNALTPAQVQTDIANSFEALNSVAPIVEMYQGDLGRLPDQAGLFYWVQQKDSGAQTLAQIAADIAGSPESMGLYGTTLNQNFLNALYANGLGRVPEPGALAYWQATGLSTSEIVAVVALSPEAIARATLPVTTFLIRAVNSPTTAYTGSLYAGTPGTTFTLTPGLDVFTGGAGNDTFNANDFVSTGGFEGATANATWTSGDEIDGGGGTNTFNVTQTNFISNPQSSTVKNIQIANLVSATGIAVNTTGWGLTTLNATSGGVISSDITADPATNITWNISALATSVTIDGGNDVRLTASETGGSGGIAIGGTTAPVGTIAVTNTLTDATGVTQVTTTVTGGTTVEITQNIAAATTSAQTNTGGAVTVNGTATTTDVILAQTAPVTAAAAAAATPGATETATVTWGSFAGAGTESIGGMTVTATGAFSAAQVAEVVGGTVIAGLTVSTPATLWTVAPTPTPGVSATNLFTSTTPNAAVAAPGSIATTGMGTTPSEVVVTTGAAATPAVAGVGGIADGAVTINDVNGTSSAKAGTITDITLNNYGATTITDNALANLNLGGTGSGTLNIADDLTTPTATTLNATVDGLNAPSGINDQNSEITILDVAAMGTASLFALADSGLKTLNVSGSAEVTIPAAGSTLPALTAVNVSGGAGLAITLGTGTAFASTSTGTDVVTITAPTSKTIKGNGTAGEELVWHGAVGPGSDASLGSVSDFDVLGIGQNVNSGTFDLSAITGFTGIEVQAGSGGFSIVKATAGTPLAIDGAITGTITYTTADAAGATDSLPLTLGTAATTAGFVVGGMVAEDSVGAGIGTLAVTSDASTAGAVNTISVLTDPGLSSLSVLGTAGLTLSTGASLITTATSLTINGSSTGTGGINLPDGVFDATLAALTVSGSDAVSLGGLGTSAPTLSLTNSGSSTVAVGTLVDAALTSLTLTGNIPVAASTVGTNGATVAGGTDNSNVSIVQGGATVSGETDSITLGNGPNSVTDTAALAGSTVTITVGTGANTITLGATAANNVAFGTHTATTADSVSALATTTGSFVPVAVITAANTSGADTIQFASDATASAFTFFSAAQLDAFAAAAESTNPPDTLANAINDVLSNPGGNLLPNTIAGFQFSGNTYFVDQNHAAGAAFSAGDTLVELTGAHTFTTASTAAAGVLHLLG